MNHRHWFYLTLVLLPSQLGFHFWPSWAHLLGRRIDYLSPTLYLNDITILLTLSFYWWGKRIASTPIKSGDRNDTLMGVGPPIPGYWRTIFLRVIPIFIILNIAFSLNPPVTLIIWLRFLVYFLWGWYIIRTKPDLALVTFFLSLSIIYASTIAILQWQRQQALGGLFWLLGERWYTPATPGIALANWCSWLSPCREVVRSYATFPHPNVLAGYLVILWPLLWLHRQKSKIITLSLCLIPFALLTTLSRMAWITWLVVTTFHFLVKLRTTNYQLRTNHPLLLFTLLALGGLIIFFPYLRSLNLQNESVTLRQALIYSAWEIWRSAPFLGTGLGASLSAYPEIIPKTNVYAFQPVHLVPLLLLTEIGVIGVFILGLLIYYFRSKFRFTLPFSLSLLTLILLSLFDHYPLSLHQGQLLTALILSLLFSP